MAKITNMIVDFPIIKQVFSDPTRAVASALFKNLRWDKINPIEVQWRLSGFLKELKKAGAKAEEIKKIEQIMLSMKLLPEKSSAKIPLTPTEQDKAIIKQSKPTNITKNGNLDNSVSTSTNNRTKSIKKPVSKPLIKNESKVNKPTKVDESQVAKNQRLQESFAKSAKTRWDKWDFTMKEIQEANKYLKSNYKGKEYTIDWKKYKVDAIDNRNEQVRLIDSEWNIIRVKNNRLPEMKVSKENILNFYKWRVQEWYKSKKIIK